MSTEETVLPNLSPETEKMLNNIVIATSVLEIGPLKNVFGPLNKIIKSLQPDPLDEINRKLDDMNEKMDNMFTVVSAALQKHELYKARTDAKSTLQNMESLLSKTTDILSVDIENLLIENMQGMHKTLNTAIEQSELFLKGYENLQSTSAPMTLSSYVGEFYWAINIAYETLCISTNSYKLVIEKYNNDRTKINQFANDKIKEEAGSWEEFTKKVENWYPNAFKPIFLGKRFRMQNVISNNLINCLVSHDKYKDYFVSWNNSAKDIIGKGFFLFNDVNSNKNWSFRAQIASGTTQELGFCSTNENKVALKFGLKSQNIVPYCYKGCLAIKGSYLEDKGKVKINIEGFLNDEKNRWINYLSNGDSPEKNPNTHYKIELDN